MKKNFFRFIGKFINTSRKMVDGLAIGIGNLMVFHAKESFDVALTVPYRRVQKMCQIWFTDDQPQITI